MSSQLLSTLATDFVQQMIKEIIQKATDVHVERIDKLESMVTEFQHKLEQQAAAASDLQHKLEEQAATAACRHQKLEEQAATSACRQQKLEEQAAAAEMTVTGLQQKLEQQAAAVETTVTGLQQKLQDQAAAAEMTVIGFQQKLEQQAATAEIHKLQENEWTSRLAATEARVNAFFDQLAISKAKRVDKKMAQAAQLADAEAQFGAVNEHLRTLRADFDAHLDASNRSDSRAVQTQVNASLQSRMEGLEARAVALSNKIDAVETAVKCEVRTTKTEVVTRKKTEVVTGRALSVPAKPIAPAMVNSFDLETDIIATDKLNGDAILLMGETQLGAWFRRTYPGSPREAQSDRNIALHVRGLLLFESRNPDPLAAAQAMLNFAYRSKGLKPL